jgi:hypothetical protein
MNTKDKRRIALKMKQVVARQRVTKKSHSGIKAKSQHKPSIWQRREQVRAQLASLILTILVGNEKSASGTNRGLPTLRD